MSGALSYLQDVAEQEGWECSQYDPEHRYMRIANGARFVDMWFAPSGRIKLFQLQLQTLAKTKVFPTSPQGKREQVIAWLSQGLILPRS